VFIDHKNKNEAAIMNGWVNDTISNVVNNPIDDILIPDKEYIEALETMVFWLSFTTGINTHIGYETGTRSDRVYNFYNSLSSLQDHN